MLTRTFCELRPLKQITTGSMLNCINVPHYEPLLMRLYLH